MNSKRRDVPKQPPTWVPPTILAAFAFALGLFGSTLDAAGKVADWFRPAPLPKVSEEYLMIALGEGTPRENLIGVMAQVAGLRVVVPTWLDSLDESRMRVAFCENNEETVADRFPSPKTPERLDLIEACMKSATSDGVLIGTYALRSFDAQPVRDLKLELAVLSSKRGYIDAYDGFILGGLSEDAACFVSDATAGDCVANRTSADTIDLPVIGPGEMVVVPIFVSMSFRWSGGTNDHVHDGLAPTPFRFPAKVRIGDRVLIGAPRKMNATPSLRQGFYESRG